MCIYIPYQLAYFSILQFHKNWAIENISHLFTVHLWLYNLWANWLIDRNVYHKSEQSDVFAIFIGDATMPSMNKSQR